VTNITITQESPLIIDDASSPTTFDTITIEAGGYIEIRVACDLTCKNFVKPPPSDLFIQNYSPPSTSPSPNNSNQTPGQEVTTPDGGPWANIQFNFWDIDGNVYALGDLYLLAEPHIGSPASLSRSAPGFIGTAAAIENKWTFDENITLQPNQHYYFYMSSHPPAGTIATTNETASGYQSYGSDNGTDNFVSRPWQLQYTLVAAVIAPRADIILIGERGDAGIPGANGAAGGAGGNGADGQCDAAGGAISKYARGGHAGSPGGDGGQGGDGENGGMGPEVTMDLGEVTGKIIIANCGGDAGIGGTGGAGGDGGAGGAGGNGKKCWAMQINGADGGAGGNGGDGGKGGSGGNGGDPNTVRVTYTPTPGTDSIVIGQSQGGAKGGKGTGGGGGKGGVGGSGGSHGGSEGSNGNPGATGLSGYADGYPGSNNKCLIINGYLY
jgi:hypothetical protein